MNKTGNKLYFLIYKVYICRDILFFQMKKTLTIILFLQCAVLSLFTQNVEIERIVESVRKSHVPDKRVGVFDVNHYTINNSVVFKGKISEPVAHQSLIQAVKDIGVHFTDSIQILPENTIGEKHWGIVPLSAIFIRSEPNFSAEITTQAILGTPVKILEKRGGWSRIQTPDRYIGWTNTKIESLTKSELSAYNKRNKLIVTDRNSVVYEKPSVHSEMIMEVIIGNILNMEKNKVSGKFTSVSLPDGTKGYIQSKSVKAFPDWQKSIRLTGDNVIETGKMFLGLPYLWGGTSSRGFDCSGFTKTIFFMYGLILPRDASQQFYCGDKITVSEEFDNLQKGDLLFFGSKTASNPDEYRVVHVAIYIGNKEFIHSSGKVRIDSLEPTHPNYDKYNHNRLIGSRRIIGSSMENVGNLFNHDWYN